MKETRIFYKTSEFWVVVVTALATVVDAAPVPDNYEGIVLAIVGVGYALARGIAKQGVPSVVDVPVYDELVDPDVPAPKGV